MKNMIKNNSQKLDVISKLCNELKNSHIQYIGTTLDRNGVIKSHIFKNKCIKKSHNKKNADKVIFPSTAVLKHALQLHLPVRNVRDDDRPLAKALKSSSGVAIKIEVCKGGEWLIIHNGALITLKQYVQQRKGGKPLQDHEDQEQEQDQDAEEQSEDEGAQEDEVMNEVVQPLQPQQMVPQQSRSYNDRFIQGYNQIADDTLMLLSKLKGLDVTLNVNVNQLCRAFASEKLRVFYQVFSDHEFNVARAKLMEHEKKRRTISPLLKQPVWTMVAGDSCVWPCYICKQPLHSAGRWAMGHVKSDMCGGESSLSNLRPVCQLCNSTVGWRHMDLYLLMNYT